jgi:hypothetical protein
VTEKARLDVRQLQRLFQQRIVQQINLPHRQVIGGAPIGVHPFEIFGIQHRSSQGHVILLASLNHWVQDFFVPVFFQDSSA